MVGSVLKEEEGKIKSVNLSIFSVTLSNLFDWNFEILSDVFAILFGRAREKEGFGRVSF